MPFWTLGVRPRKRGTRPWLAPGRPAGILRRAGGLRRVGPFAGGGADRTSGVRGEANLPFLHRGRTARVLRRNEGRSPGGSLGAIRKSDIGAIGSDAGENGKARRPGDAPQAFSRAEAKEEERLRARERGAPAGRDVTRPRCRHRRLRQARCLEGWLLRLQIAENFPLMRR